MGVCSVCVCSVWVCMCVGINWGSKCQLSMSQIVGEDSGGTSGVHTFTCETWYNFLWDMVQLPVGYQEDFPVLTPST